MNRPFDDAELRQLCERLRSVERDQVPDFERIMALPPRPSQRRSNRVVFALTCSFAIFAVAVLVRSFQHSDHSASLPTGKPPGSAVEVDFDYLRQVVDEHFDVDEPDKAMTLWSSSTESLLVLNLDVTPVQE